MADDELEAWVLAHWRRDLPLRAWWQALADAGLAFPDWPVADGGRGWDQMPKAGATPRSLPSAPSAPSARRRGSAR